MCVALPHDDLYSILTREGTKLSFIVQTCRASYMRLASETPLDLGGPLGDLFVMIIADVELAPCIVL